MGVRIIESRDGKMAALYDSGSMWAFGPLFTGEVAATDAAAFLHFVATDPRLMTERELEKRYMDWRQATDDR